ncbi:MAG: pre-peptidase C-terminal domain-containing protein [Acidobacteria bacterium]|nr:pre-peptidase C-terminal domain-containing protein [Acidobacteriota bacterium]
MKTRFSLQALGAALSKLFSRGVQFAYDLRYSLILILVMGILLIPFATPAAKDKKNAAALPAATATPKPAPAQEPTGIVVGSGQQAAGTGSVQPRRATGPVTSELPVLTDEQKEMRDEEEIETVPVPQGRVYSSIPPPQDPPTQVAVGGTGAQPNAPNDFKYQLVHDFTASEVATSQRSSTNEPSVGNIGNTVFYTGNWYAARSTDGGQSFSYINPYTNFPSVNNGFCCDQIVNYVPVQDMIVWGLQYNRDSNTGTLRIARAVGASDVANNAWTYYDFTPQTFGFANGNWMDFPNITLGATYVYFTSNVFSTTCPGGNCPFTGSVIWRVPRTELAAGGGINFGYLTQTNVGSLRCTEGAGTTMYWGSWLTTSSMRIFRWDDSSGTIFWDDVSPNAFTYMTRGSGLAGTTDGTNWAAFSDSRILGAWVANGIIGFMWGARQDGTFPYPYTIIARFNQATRALVTQNQVWNGSYGWLFPTASVNSAQNLAGLLVAGGGTLFPLTNIWIVDDVQSSFQPIALYYAIGSNAGPTSNRWGDFHTVRPHKNQPNSWVASTFGLIGGGGNSNAVQTYIWFGRERDISCPFTVSPTSNTFNSAGGTGGISVTNSTNCNWTASSSCGWVTITSGSTGAGNGTVNYSVGANFSTLPRSCTLNVAGTSVTINQSGVCVPTPISVGATVGGALTTSDCRSISGGSWYADWYTFSGFAGQRIAITESSTAFDTYLQLIGPSGTVIAFDDDGGGGTNSRIPAGSGFFTLPSSGTYTIEASSFAANATGAYTVSLTVDTMANLQFYPLPHPIRLLDTRTTATSGCDQPHAPIAGGTSRTQTAAGRTCDGITIPSSARALTGNVTTVQSGGGFLTLYPSDAARPNVANTNYLPNEVVNNVFTVGIGAGDGAFKIYALNTTDVVVDVTGYYAPPGTGGLYFHPLPTPIRLLETRPSQPGCFTPGVKVFGGIEQTQLARVTCGSVTIPANAQAIVGNATVVMPSTNGFLTLWPNGATRPVVASSNYSAGQVVNASFTVGLGGDGRFGIYSVATTDLVVDVLGYFSPDATDLNGTGLLFTPLAHPVRLLETRPTFTGCYMTGAPLAGGSTRTQPARVTCESLTIPSSALGVVGNATVVGPASNGFLTLWPSNAAQPTTATSNYAMGRNWNRHFTVGLGPDGAFKIFPSATTDLVLDVSGFYAP